MALHEVGTEDTGSELCQCAFLSEAHVSVELVLWQCALASDSQGHGSW